MIDNGAFTLFNSGKSVDWSGYYEWLDEFLWAPTTWCIPPDVIGGDETQNDELLAVFPFPKHKAKPVWHLHESIDRLMRLLDEWEGGVCFGSSADYSQVGSCQWHDRVTEAWDSIARAHRATPWVHMLRGMKTVRMGCYPFASVDSTDVARNHHLGGNAAHAHLMADEWDTVQCPPVWVIQPKQVPLF